MSETKKCPFCKGEIALEAIKCKHCKKFLNDLSEKEIIKSEPEPNMDDNESIPLEDDLSVSRGDHSVNKSQKKSMKKYFIIFFFFVILTCILIYFFKSETKEIKYPNGQLKEKYKVNTDSLGNEVYDGLYESWYENGNKKFEKNYKDGKLDGPASFRYENGNIKGESNFINDKQVGLVKTWYESGKLGTESYYKDGKTHGLRTYWYKNGNKEQESNFNNGELSGLSKGWYDNGNIKYEENFQYGKLEGLKSKWFENGNKLFKGTYNDGKLEGIATNWYENGNKEDEYNYTNNTREGLGIWWYENGEIFRKEGYINGIVTNTEYLDKNPNPAKKIILREFYENSNLKSIKYATPNKNDNTAYNNGSYTSYYEDGNIQSKAIYKDGEYDGLWTAWYENGNKMFEQNYKNGKLDGLFTKWNNSNDKISEILYENDKIFKVLYKSDHANESDKSDNVFNQNTQNMILVEGRTFQMGIDNPETKENTSHEVSLNNFYIAKYEITNGQWFEFLSDLDKVDFDKAKKHITNEVKYDKNGNLQIITHRNKPASNISWYMAIEYCNWLSEKEGFDKCYTIDENKVEWNILAKGYRLPTEAEWEYAAKGGNKSKGSKFSGSSNYLKVSWMNENSGGVPHNVGTKQPNELGLYDMSGNLREWCWDWFDTYILNPQTNPKGSNKGTTRVVRGGSWDDYYGEYISFLYCTHRDNGYPHAKVNIAGFRIAKNK